MNNAPINVGDVVQLNSGGSPMTVESFDGATPISAAERMVHCIWHGADGATHERSFWPRTLVLDAKFAEAKKAEQAAAEQRAVQLSKEAEAKRVSDEQKANRQLQSA